MVIAGRGQKTDVKRLDAIGREVKALKLSNEKTLLSSLAIAKAVKTENIDKILAACEKELPKLGKDSQMIAYYLSGSLAKSPLAKNNSNKYGEINSEKLIIVYLKRMFPRNILFAILE